MSPRAHLFPSVLLQMISTSLTAFNGIFILKTAAINTSNQAVLLKSTLINPMVYLTLPPAWVLHPVDIAKLILCLPEVPWLCDSRLGLVLREIVRFERGNWISGLYTCKVSARCQYYCTCAYCPGRSCVPAAESWTTDLWIVPLPSTQ